jgi:hypothetical protein
LEEKSAGFQGGNKQVEGRTTLPGNGKTASITKLLRQVFSRQKTGAAASHYRQNPSHLKRVKWRFFNNSLKK